MDRKYDFERLKQKVSILARGAFPWRPSTGTRSRLKQKVSILARGAASAGVQIVSGSLCPFSPMNPGGYALPEWTSTRTENSKKFRVLEQNLT